MAENIKNSRDKILCILAIGVMVACFAVERMMEVTVTLDKTTSIIMAMIFTVALAAVYFVVSKTKDVFFGLLTSIIGYRMMPPPISSLSNMTNDVAALYYLVQKISIVIFVVMIIRLFLAQKETKQIHLIPILAIMFIVPFFGQIGENYAVFFMRSFGSMYYYYFTKYAFYALAVIVTLLVALRSNYDTFRFVTYYEFVALSINILKRVGFVTVFMIKGEHISKNNFAWIAIFATFIVIFAVAKNIRKKKHLAQA